MGIFDTEKFKWVFLFYQYVISVFLKGNGLGTKLSCSSFLRKALALGWKFNFSFSNNQFQSRWEAHLKETNGRSWRNTSCPWYMWRGREVFFYLCFIYNLVNKELQPTIFYVRIIYPTVEYERKFKSKCA